MSNQWKIFWKDIGIGIAIFIVTVLCMLWKVPVLGNPIALLLSPAVGIFLCLLHTDRTIMVIEAEESNEVRIELKSEATISRDPARVFVYIGNQLVAEVRAHIEQEQGADGGYYPVVKLKNVETHQEPPKT